MLTSVFVKIDSCGVGRVGGWLTIDFISGFGCSEFVRGVEMMGCESNVNSVNAQFVRGVEIRGSYHTFWVGL